MMRNTIPVRIGEVKVARHGETLKAILGSCVGIAFIWKEKQIVALAHCLLPENPHKENAISARYVNDAIPSLIALMKITDEDKRSVEVHIAGGGNMTTKLSSRDPAYPVGVLNVSAAEKYLKAYGFKIRSAVTGGMIGRQIAVSATTLTHHVSEITHSS